MPTPNSFFKKNQFREGGDYFLGAASVKKSEFTTQHGFAFINAMRLLIFVEPPAKIQQRLAQFKTRLESLDYKQINFELALLQVRLAYDCGFHRRSYNLASILLASIEKEGEENELSKEHDLPSLLARVHLMLGKSLYRALDHSLARVHLGLAYDCIALQKESKEEVDYIAGRILTVFARSYFDYRPEHGAIQGILIVAKWTYQKYFGSKSPSKHLYYTEIEELECLRLIEFRDENWFNIVRGRLDREERHLRAIFNTSNHRRVAHLCYLRGLAYLNKARDLRATEKGEFTDLVVSHLRQAEKHFLRECEIRLNVFDSVGHPTLARTYNYLCSAQILLAESRYLKGDKEAGDKMMARAKGNIEKAFKVNTLKQEELLEDERVSKQEGAVFAVDSTDGIPTVDRLRKFKTQSRLLKYHRTKYLFAPESEKELIFKEVKSTYQECHKNLLACIHYLNGDESVETVLARFLPMQEHALEVCQAEYERVNEKGQEDYLSQVLDLMFNVHFQGKRNEDWIKRMLNVPLKPEALELAGFRTKKALIQKFHHKHFFILPKNQPDNIIPPAIDFPDYQATCKELIRLNFVGMRERQQEAKELYNNSLSLFHKDSVDMTKICEEFSDPDNPAGIISYFAGFKHLYVLAGFQGPSGIRAEGMTQVAWCSSTNYSAFSKVKEIESTAKRLNTTIKFIHQTLEKERVDGRSHFPKELNEFTQRLLLSDSFNFVKEQENAARQYISFPSASSITKSIAVADRLNSLWLMDAHKIFTEIIDTIYIPRFCKRIYLTFNREWMQKIPFSLLPMDNPMVKFAGEKQAKFSDLNYLGINYQHSIIPCIADLWKLRKKSRYPKFEKKQTEKCADRLLDQRHLKLLLAVRGIDTKPDYDGETNNLSATGAEHLDDLYNIFKGQGDLHFSPRVGSRSVRSSQEKKHLLRVGQLAAIIYFMTHLEFEESGKEHRKRIELVARQALSLEERAEMERVNHRSDYDVYHEEVAENDFNNNWLTFINGCGAAEGMGRHGYMPFSVMAAFLDGGSRTVIGTQYTTYAVPAAAYATLLFTLWTGALPLEVFPKEKSIGEVMQVLNEQFLHNPHQNDDIAKYANPLHWGTYLQLGDTTITFNEIIAFLSGLSVDEEE